jgi:RNA polymerase sigma-70 factor (ECF subfamily)
MSLSRTEEHLARQAQQGDREAFIELYHLYFPKVYNRVRSKVPPQYVEDVTQEIFIAVIRSLEQFEQRSRFGTWLYTIVNRQIADFYRQRYRTNDRSLLNLDGLETMTGEPESSESQSDDRVIIQNALIHLPEHYQEVILQRFADGLTFAEIAEQRQQSLEAVKSLYRRAIQALRDQIGGM